jgi:hypothetical protein
MSSRILYNNLWDGGTLTDSSEASGYAGTNTQQRWPTRVWRSTGITSEWIKVNLGSAKAIQALVLHDHNLTAGATVTLQGNATDSWGAPSYNQALTWAVAGDGPYTTFCYFPASTQTYQWWRLTVADTGNTAGYLSVGRIFLGPYTGLTRTYKSRKSSYEDPSVVETSIGGQKTSFQLTRYRTWQYDLPNIASDKSTLLGILKVVGTSVPWFFCEDSTYPSVMTFYVQYAGAMSFSYNADDYQVEAASMKLEEMR